MRKRMIQMMLFIVCLLLFAACEKEIEKHNERPDFLKGNAWEVLADRGNYQLFLQGAELAGFRDVLEGKGLCTVFAPDNEAMKHYLNGKSLQDIPENELKVLIGMHIVEYSFSYRQLLDFQHYGDAGPGQTPAGLNYKQRTFAKEEISEMTDPMTGRKVRVYHKEKYLPVFSTRLFSTRKLENPESDYLYFYPDSKWYGTEDKLYAANAGITEYAIPSDNGYVYLLDDVIRPLRTVYQVMEDRAEDYSVFRDVYNRFADVKYDKSISEEHAATGDSLFLFYHKELPKIASEWTYNDEGSTGWKVPVLSGIAFNLMAPDNAAMEQYLREFFEGNYDSYEQLPLLTLYYLAQNHVKEGSIVFPDNLRQGETSIYGDKYDLDKDEDITYKEICTNGVFYGVNKVVTPAMFRSVTAPVFKDEDYSIFAYILHKATELTQLINMENDYTLFIPTNEAFETFMHYRLNLGDGIWGNEKLECETSPGKWEKVSDADMIEIAQQHIVLGKIGGMRGQKIWSAKGNLTYVITDDGTVRGEGSEAVEPLKAWKELENGSAYVINSILKKSENTIVQSLRMSDRYSKFYAKLVEAEVIDKDGLMPFLGGEQAVVLALDNDAMEQLTLPTDKQELADYLSYYFVSLGINKLTDYLLPGYKVDGNFRTLQIDRELSTAYETVYKQMYIRETGDGRMEVADVDGTAAVVTAAGLPLFASDGVIYTLDKPIVR